MGINRFFYEHPVFSYQEFVSWKVAQGTTNKTAIRMSLQYYVKRGQLLSLRRELYAVIPPNASAENLKVDPYLIAGKSVSDAVLAYHTALELHGLAYSSFEQFTFLTQHKVKSFEIDGQRYQPVTFPKALFKSKNKQPESVGVETINRQGVDLKITNISRTFVDVIDRIGLSGGLEEVGRSVEKIAVLNVDEVIKYCLMLGNARLAAKVGYFLEQRTGAFAVSAKLLQPLLEAKPRAPQYLSTELQKNCRLVKKWNLMIPEYVLNKVWEEPNDEI